VEIDAFQIVALIANVGVIAGIVFLALELRQANRIAVASTEISIRSNLSALNESIYGSEGLSRLLAKASDADADLAPEEVIRMESFVRRLLNAYLALETAHFSGLAPKMTYESIENDIRGILSSWPALRPIFRQIADLYPAQESSSVYQMLERVLDE
jgi:hypothetical protein